MYKRQQQSRAQQFEFLVGVRAGVEAGQMMERQLFALPAQLGVTLGRDALQLDEKIVAPGDDQRAVLHELLIPESQLRIDPRGCGARVLLAQALEQAVACLL